MKDIDYTGIALIITAIGSIVVPMISGIVSAFAAYFAWQANANVEEVSHNTNAMKDELVAAALLRGKTEGRSDEVAAQKERDSR